MTRRVLYRFRQGGAPASPAGGLSIALTAALACWQLVQRNQRGAAWIRIMMGDAPGRALVKALLLTERAVEQYSHEHDRLLDAWWWRLDRLDLVKKQPGLSNAAAALRRARTCIADLHGRLDRVFEQAIAEAEARDAACRSLLDGSAHPSPDETAVITTAQAETHGHR